MTSDKGTHKIQILQGSFKFRPMIIDKEVARLTNGLSKTIWNFSNKEITLQKLYESYVNPTVAFDDLLEFANRLKNEKPKAKFSGFVFAIKPNDDDRDENGRRIKKLKACKYTLYESKAGETSEIAIHCDYCNIRMSRMKTEEELEAAREKRRQMKERTLAANKKVLAGGQIENIPEPAPRKPSLNRHKYDLNIRKIGEARPVDAPPPKKNLNQNRIQRLLQSSINLDEDDRPKKKSKRTSKQ